MTSALTHHGSTRQWRTLRAGFNHTLTTNGPTPCPHCHHPVHPDHHAHLNPDHQPFDLDHTTPRAHGGTDHPTNLQPAHAHCNRSAGARQPKHQTREW